jgi:hypothetical protein
VITTTIGPIEPEETDVCSKFGFHGFSSAQEPAEEPDFATLCLRTPPAMRYGSHWCQKTKHAHRFLVAAEEFHEYKKSGSKPLQAFQTTSSGAAPI